MSRAAVQEHEGRAAAERIEVFSVQDVAHRSVKMNWLNVALGRRRKPKQAKAPAAKSMQDVQVSPHYAANIVSRWTYSWMNDLMALGKTRPLDKLDLYALRADHNATALADELDAAWAKRMLYLYRACVASIGGF